MKMQTQKQTQTVAQKLVAQKARNAAQNAARNAVPKFAMGSAITKLPTPTGKPANPFTALHASGKANNRHKIFALLVAAPTVQAHYAACKAAKLRTGNWDVHNAQKLGYIKVAAPK